MKIKMSELRQIIREEIINVKKLNKNMIIEREIPADSYVWIEPTGAAFQNEYPAAKWLKKKMKVKLIDDAPNRGTLDVLDVETSDGTEKSIYDFNIVKKA